MAYYHAALFSSTPLRKKIHFFFVFFPRPGNARPGADSGRSHAPLPPGLASAPFRFRKGLPKKKKNNAVLILPIDFSSKKVIIFLNYTTVDAVLFKEKL